MDDSSVPLQADVYMPAREIFYLHTNHRLMKEGCLSPGMVYLPIKWPNTAAAMHLDQLGKVGTSVIHELNEVGGIFGVVMFNYGFYGRLTDSDYDGEKVEEIARKLAELFGVPLGTVSFYMGRDIDNPDTLDQPLAAGPVSA